MKMLALITLFITLTLPAFSPDLNVLYVPESVEIKPFKPLIKAIGYVECKFDTLAYNPEEQATGYFQIRPIRIDDFNKRTGSDYKLSDMYDYDKAEIVFLYYASKIGPYDLEKIAKSWNGSGYKTIKYWNKVKQNL